MAPSSLALAAASSRTTENKNGNFEANFHGLDLSELMTTTHHDGKEAEVAAAACAATSASAALLSVKARETQQRQREHEEESKLMRGILVSNRAQAAAAASQAEKSGYNKKSSLENVLVGMHQSDKRDSSRIKLKRDKKKNRVRKQQSANKTVATSKMKVTKTTRCPKF